MASLGKFHYYSTTAPTLDAAFGYPILQAPPNKALKIIQLAVFNGTNSANTEINLAILPSTTSKLNDGSYSMIDNQAFVVGLIAAALTGSTIVTPLTYAGIATKGAFSEIIIPPGAILLGFAPTVNLNGTVEYRSIAYECNSEGY
ncbi:MAG: hypothetical protein [Circular genetic element sp.]|nr:MAG: hypothetical protein [Circular genetic element sp.]|tara:strand:- start:2645 stop:3079 length:435 start_codon:yes stop_codon:yes gene_type:complete